MNTDVIDDLKQFIVATTSQQTADIRATIDELIKKDDQLSAQINDLAMSVGEAISSGNESTDGQLADHEHRITKLEQSTA